MKAVRWTDLVEVGQVLSTHGYDGTLKITIDAPYRKFITENGWPDDLPYALFLKLRGDMVPLMIQSVAGDDPLLISWKNLTDENSASTYISSLVYLHVHAITEEVQTEEPGPLEGYACYDMEVGRLGIVQEYLPDEYGDKLRLRIDDDGNEVTIPFPEEYIEAIDEETAVITLRLPEGLWELMIG